MNPTPYPSQEQHAQAWAALARAIAATVDQIGEMPPTQAPARPGELTVIGSGIESVGFTLGDEDLIRSADAVFYCVADPATVVWLKTVRPDAYDLYVLYDDSKVRYTTYMQMAEAMLHFVRQGKKVTAVYYGHPGIFVLATHRAIQIARREGHQAQMRPAVCALDCLCADLGVDPCHPGMQTHEATDMLIRGRAPDTSLHVVLWQVGLIGEMGYRRQGYLNQNFSVFIAYLQQHYGADYPITHYVASRYPSIPATIETYPLAALHDPQTQTKVTGISTFYLAPQHTVEANPAMLARLGLLKPGQTLRPADGPLREIGGYGERERKAFAAFAQFQVPQGYQWQKDTPASRFIIALRQDFSLRERYRRDPLNTVAEASFVGLTLRERSLLASRDAGSVQIAAKGSGIVSAENLAFLRALYTQSPLSVQLQRLLQANSHGDARQQVETWATGQGYPLDWARLRTDINLAGRNRLFPWVGAYQTEDGRLVMLTGDGSKAKLFVDGRRVRRFSYRHGALHWQADAAGGGNGFLRTDASPQGRRRLVGSLWSDGVSAARPSLTVREGAPGREHLSQAVGCYVRSGVKPSTLDIEVVETAERGRHLRVALDGAELAGPATCAGRVLTVAGQRFMLSAGPANPDAWVLQDALLPTALVGCYPTSTAGGGGLQSFAIGPDGIHVNGVEPKSLRRRGGSVQWSGGPPACPSGQVNLLLDPVTLYPGVFGSVETVEGPSRKCFGLLPPPTDLRRVEPEFGLSGPAWAQLVAASAQGAPFFWHQWQKARLAATLVNALAKWLP